MRRRDNEAQGSSVEAWAWVGLVVALRLAYAVYSQITYDDAHISLRYATNLATGHGLVFNPGERVFGASTPLYVLLLAVFARSGLPMPLFLGPAPLAWGKLVAVLADGATALLWYRLFRRETGSRWPGRFFVLLFGLSPLMIETAVSGMETSLVLFGMTLALTAALEEERLRAREEWPAALRLGGAIGFLGLLRPDALLFGAVLLLFRAGRTHRVPWRPLLVASACLMPWYLFAWQFYGSPIPNSIPAKVAAYNDHERSYWRAFRTVWAHVGPYHNGFGAEGFKWVSFPLLLLGIARLRAYPRLVVLPVYAATYLIFLLLPHTLLFRWYLPPALLAIYGLCGLGITAVGYWVLRVGCWVSAVGCRREGEVIDLAAPSPSNSNTQYPTPNTQHPTATWPLWAHGLAAVLWLGLAVHTARWTARTADRARRVQWAENHVRRDIGLWLREHTPAEARVATEPIGYIGYYSHRRIVDEVGLVTPRMIPLNRAGDGWFGRMVRAERPDYVVERYYYLEQNRTLLTGVRMFATPSDRDWFFRQYQPVKWYCWDLAGRLRLSPMLERDYGFVIFARTDRVPGAGPWTVRRSGVQADGISLEH